MAYNVAVIRRTVTVSSLATSTTTSNQRQQQQQQQHITLEDDFGHYEIIHDVDELDHHNNNLEFNRPTIDDDNEAVEQRQGPTSNYEQLDPSTLRQPSAPSVYARLSPPNTSDASRIISTGQGERNPTYRQRDDPASLNES